MKVIFTVLHISAEYLAVLLISIGEVSWKIQNFKDYNQC